MFDLFVLLLIKYILNTLKMSSDELGTYFSYCDYVTGTKT